ncbi:RNA polymerase sigma factor SigF, partial [Streptomyces niveus]
MRDEERVPQDPREGHEVPVDPALVPSGIPEQQARPHPVDGLDGQTGAEQERAERAATMSEHR